MTIGIIAALDLELNELKAAMADTETETVSGIEFVRGTVEGRPVVAAVCGIGKVYAAMCAQTMCDRYGVTHLVNTGIAGSLDAALDIGDVVVSRDVMYHDFDCHFVNYPIGQVPGQDVLAFPADEALIRLAFDF